MKKENAISKYVNAHINNISFPKTIEQLEEFIYEETLTSYLDINFETDTANPLYYTQTIKIDGQNPFNLEIPSGIKEVKKCEFVNCHDIKSLILPESVETIAPFAFAYSSLESINFNGTSNLKNIQNNAFAHCFYIKKLRLPKSVEIVDLQAFYECKTLEHVSFENNNNLQKLGQKVFYECRALKSIFIGHNSQLTEMGSECLYNCRSLTYFSFGNNSKIQTIGASAFRECKPLKELYIPATCQKIGDWCFSGCFQGSRGDPEDLVIYAENTTRPAGWENNYNSSNNIVYWGVTYPTLPDDFSF